jgi:RecA-family ATPase
MTVEEAQAYLHIKRGSEIAPRSVSFVWKPFLQKSAFHLLVGPKGVGKGSTLAWAAAQMTQGQLDDGTPRRVLWISTEDSFDIDVIPRIRAQSGEADMILCVQQSVRLPQDIPALRSTCEAENVGMVIIDPIVGTTGGIDSNDEGSVIDAIGGLNKLADDLDICIVGVRHQGKGTERSGLERVLGSVAWVNTPRAVIGISQEDDNHFERTVKLELLAGNRTQRGATQEFYLGDRLVPGLAIPVSYVTPKTS